VDGMFDKIREVRAAGTTVVMVEQNARRALEVSDRAYVLEQGQTRVEGRGEELLASEAVRRAYLGSGAAGRSPSLRGDHRGSRECALAWGGGRLVLGRQVGRGRR